MVRSPALFLGIYLLVVGPLGASGSPCEKEFSRLARPLWRTSGLKSLATLQQLRAQLSGLQDLESLPADVRGRLRMGGDPFVEVPGLAQTAGQAYLKLLAEIEPDAQARAEAERFIRRFRVEYGRPGPVPAEIEEQVDAFLRQDGVDRLLRTTDLNHYPTLSQLQQAVTQVLAGDGEPGRLTQALARREGVVGWAASFSPAVRREGLRQALLELKETLDPELRRKLEAGEDPFRLIPGLARLVRDALDGEIQRSRIPSQEKKALAEALARFVDGYERRNPDLLAARDPEQTARLAGAMDKEVRDKLQLFLKNGALARCAARTGTLLFVSEAVTSVGAAYHGVMSRGYAGKNVPSVGKAFEEVFTDGQVWQNAAKDPHFAHNLIWNGLLTTSVGAFSCLNGIPGIREDSRFFTKKNLVGAMALTTSAAAQYIAGHGIELRMLALDTLWVRFISTWKSGKAFQAAEWYRGRGLPAALMAEAFLQLVSEGIGAFTYPVAQQAVSESDKYWERLRQWWARVTAGDPEPQ